MAQYGFLLGKSKWLYDNDYFIVSNVSQVAVLSHLGEWKKNDDAHIF